MEWRESWPMKIFMQLVVKSKSVLMLINEAAVSFSLLSNAYFSWCYCWCTIQRVFVVILREFKVIRRICANIA